MASATFTKAGNICAFYVITVSVFFFTVFNTGIVNIFHDAFQSFIYLFTGPTDP